MVASAENPELMQSVTASESILPVIPEENILQERTEDIQSAVHTFEDTREEGSRLAQSNILPEGFDDEDEESFFEHSFFQRFHNDSRSFGAGSSHGSSDSNYGMADAERSTLLEVQNLLNETTSSNELSGASLNRAPILIQTLRDLIARNN